MIRRSLTALVILALCAFLPSTAVAQTQHTGTTSGGAHYSISVPDGWTPANGLVIWNHGFTLDPIGPVTDLGPLAAVQLAEGYAVAASSYSLTGWAVFETAEDNRDMVKAFEAEFGVPQFIILNGASLGGIVTARDIEAGFLDNVVGALPICGAVAGSRVWDGGFDVRQIYDTLCDAVPGGEIPQLPGLPYLPPPTFDENALGLAVNTCIGILLPAEARTAEQADRLAKFLAVTGLPESFVLIDMGFAVYGLADLLYDPRKMGGANPFDNAHVVYGDAAINASIGRVSPDPGARERLVEYFTPSGKVGSTKIVSLHTDKDGLIIIENESSYASVVPAQNFTLGVVVEDEPTHCGFTEAEVIASWESLRGWIAGLPQPSATDLQNACLAIEGGGLAEGPCRIDPNFVVPNIDGRVRPRNVCVPDNQSFCLGGGRFEVSVTWENFEGDTGVGKVLDQYGDESGAFYFFQDDRAELMVKVVDGRQFNGNFWFFAGSLTNVEFELTVTDMVTSVQKVYSNPSGDFASIGDTSAF